MRVRACYTFLGKNVRYCTVYFCTYGRCVQSIHECDISLFPPSFLLYYHSTVQCILLLVFGKPLYCTDCTYMVMLLPVVLLHIVENDLRRREAMFRERERERERDKLLPTSLLQREKLIQQQQQQTESSSHNNLSN